jgi:hypothetical protein
VDVGQSANIRGTFSVGTTDDANTILSTNRAAWLTAQADQFHVNRIVVTELGNQWESVDLSTETANTDADYRLLNAPGGDYVQAIGLDAAQAQFAQIQTNYLAFYGLASYQTLTEWPASPA